jgi:hypothetical protein
MEFVASLLDSKLFTGAMMIAMNFGTRHVVAELTPVQERFMASLVVRRFVLFAIFYVAVRDLMASLALTFFFTVLMSTLLNESSSFSLL